MARKQIDCYGFEAASEYFGIKKLKEYLIRKAADGAVYMCFHDTEERPIHRVDIASDGSTRVMWAYGRWDDAEDLEYVPINDTLEVEI